MKTVWRVFGYLKRYPLLAAGTLTCAVLGTFMVIIFPAVTKWIINDVVRANHPEKLLPLVLLAAAAFLLPLTLSLNLISSWRADRPVRGRIISSVFMRFHIAPAAAEEGAVRTESR